MFPIFLYLSFLVGAIAFFWACLRVYPPFRFMIVIFIYPLLPADCTCTSRWLVVHNGRDENLLVFFLLLPPILFFFLSIIFFPLLQQLYVFSFFLFLFFLLLAAIVPRTGTLVTTLIR